MNLEEKVALLEVQLSVALTVKENALSAVDAANQQLEELYATCEKSLTIADKAAWRARIGLANPMIASKSLTFDFPVAIRMLKDGHRVTRLGWNGKNMWLCLQKPDDFSKMTLPYIYMRTAQADLVPWLCSQTDLLADDWKMAT